MSTMSSPPVPSEQAIDELRTTASRLRPAACAGRLWDRYLTPEDRDRLGGNPNAAYARYGTAGMWVELRGVTPQRAVIDVANKLGLLRDEDYPWLLREIGEFVDVDEALADAIASGAFVLVESPREAYWNSERIEIDWDQRSALWEFLWEVGQHAKAGRPIDAFTFGAKAHRDVVTKRKSRLTSMAEFPVDLAEKIEWVSRGHSAVDDAARENPHLRAIRRRYSSRVDPVTDTPGELSPVYR